MSNNFSQTGSNWTEYWLPQGNLGGHWKKWFPICNQGRGDEFIEDISDDALKPEPLNKVCEIVKERLLAQRKRAFTVAIDKSDLLPLSFMEIGSKRSMAVCRIARYFSLETFQELIQAIIDSQEVGKYNERPILEEIFEIPPQIAPIIFKAGLKPLEALKQISENQLSLINPIAIGTGFLVGGTHLLTNHHVITNKEEAQKCVAQFNYVKDALGGTQTILEYEFDPEILFVYNASLDYTLVQLKAGMFKRQPGYVFGWLQLIEDEVNVAPGISKDMLNGLKNSNSLVIQKTQIPGDRVFIIQHPKGQQKQFVQNDNYIMEYPKGLLRDFLRYTAVSDYGSSGSPVFNSNWDLIALHHAAIPKEPNANGNKVETEEIEAYQGVRICRIIEDLKKNSFSNPKLRSFIEDFVITSEQLNSPPLPAAIELDGQKSYVNADSRIALISVSSKPHAYVYDSVQVNLWDRIGLNLGNFTISELYPYYSYDLGDTYPYCSLSPDGKILAAVLRDGSVGLWNLQGEQLTKLKEPEKICFISFSPDGKTLATVLENNTLILWNLKGKSPAKLETPGEIKISTFSAFNFSSDGKLLATILSSNKNVAKLWNLQCQRLVELFQLEDDEISQFIFNPNGRKHPKCAKTLLTFSENPMLPLIFGAICKIGMLPNGKFLTTTSLNSNAVKLWDLQRKHLVKLLQLEDDEISQFIFSPDGKFMAITSLNSNVVKLWDLQRKHLVKLESINKNERFFSIIFSPNSKFMATALEDKDNCIVILWDLEKKKRKALAKVVEKSGSSVKLRFEKNFVSYITSNGTFKLWTLDAKLKTSFKIDNYNFATHIPLSSPIISSNSDDCYSFGGVKQFTIEAWIAPYSGGGMIVSKFVEDPYFLSENPLGEYALFLDKEGYIIFRRIRVEPSKEFAIGFQVTTFSSLPKGLIQENYWDVIKTKKAIPFRDFSHIAAVYSDNCIKVYINGNLEGSLDTDAKQNKDITIPILVGASFSKSSSGEETLSNFFHGAIAEVRIWKTARTQKQIKAKMHWRLRSDEPELVGYWRFEEGEGDKVYNLASKSDYGLVCGAKWSRVSQYPTLPLPCGLKLSEKKDKIDCGNHQSLNITEDDKEEIKEKITVEAWVKHKFGNGLIVGRGGQEENGYSLFWYEGKIRIALQGENPSEKTVIDTKDNAPSDGVWHHIAFTWDKKSQEIAIYIDGRRQDSVVIEGRFKSIVFQGQYKSIGLFQGSISRLTGKLMIGTKEDNEKILNEESYFNVAIAQVRLWKVFRTQDQIKANMSRRLEYFTEEERKGLIGYWRLDDGGEDNNQVRNLVSNNNHGTVHGAKWFPASPSTPQDQPT